MITLIPYFQLYLLLELKMESEERVWENCCQKANWQQSQLPISVWWLSYTRPSPTSRQTEPTRHHQKTPPKIPSAILLKHAKADC